MADLSERMATRLHMVHADSIAAERENERLQRLGKFSRKPAARQAVPDTTDHALERRGLVKIAKGVGKYAKPAPIMCITLTPEGMKAIYGTP